MIIEDEDDSFILKEIPRYQVELAFLHHALETELCLLLIGERLDLFYSMLLQIVLCRIILGCDIFCYCVQLCVIVIVYLCECACVHMHGHMCVCVCESVCVCMCV